MRSGSTAAVVAAALRHAIAQAPVKESLYLENEVLPAVAAALRRKPHVVQDAFIKACLPPEVFVPNELVQTAELIAEKAASLALLAGNDYVVPTRV